MDTRTDMGRRGLYGLLILPQNRPGYLLARRLHIHPERLSEYALGRRQIPTRVLLRMCTILNATAEEIICDWQPLTLNDDPICQDV